jgi:hypothetical protein
VLGRVEGEARFIGHWAGTEYGEDSHDDSWFNPFWGVADFPSEGIDGFSRTTAAHFFGSSLAESVETLSSAIARFRSLLASHYQRLADTDEAFKRRLLAIVAPRFKSNGGPGLTLEDLNALPGLSVEDRAWLRETYRHNKEVHTLGIGRAGEPDKLYEARRNCLGAMPPARLNATRPPIAKWLENSGHCLAAVFALTGTYLLLLALLLHFLRSDSPKTGTAGLATQSVHAPSESNPTATQAPTPPPNSRVESVASPPATDSTTQAAGDSTPPAHR